MRNSLLLIAVTATAVLFAGAAVTQAPPQAALVLTRMSSAYRTLQSFQDVATVKRKVGKKELTATLTVAMQKPNKYLLELKGDKVNTVILSDGSSLVASRPDRKAYTKMKAPQQFMRSDFIGPADMPSLGAKIVTQFLTGTGREGALGKLLLDAKVTGPQAFGVKYAYVFTFPYDEDTEAQVFVTSDDYLVRQVKLMREGEAVWTETHDTILLDKPLPADTFVKPVPEGAILVTKLPELEKPSEVAAEEEADTTNVDPQIALGRSTFRSNGCARCHAIRGQGGRMGPDLSQIGAERTPDWIMEHILNPQAHNPSSRMPAYEGRIRERELKALGTYLGNLK